MRTVKINWKILIIFGGFAFFLSFLVGVISRVGFGIILLRGIISAVLFAGVGFVISILVKKFLPDLNPGGDNNKEEGGTIDIVIEDEGEIVPRLADDEETDADMERDAVTGAIESSGASGEDLVALSEDEEETGSFIEEVEEVSGEGLARGSDDVSSDEADLVPLEDDENVDTLPDVDKLSGSFEEDAASDDEDEVFNERVSRISDDLSTTDVLGRDENPEALAKAIQTMIKRDDA